MRTTPSAPIVAILPDASDSRFESRGIVEDAAVAHEARIGIDNNAKTVIEVKKERSMSMVVFSFKNRNHFIALAIAAVFWRDMQRVADGAVKCKKGAKVVSL